MIAPDDLQGVGCLDNGVHLESLLRESHIFQAVEDIEYYQNEMPDIYDAYRDRLGVIKSAMHSVRIELDSPLAPENDRRL